MNTITTKRHPKRSDEEWIQIIQECRTSGLTDKKWCEEHHIAPSNLYYHIRRLTEKACGAEIPENPRVSSRETHEVVPLRVSEEAPFDDLIPEQPQTSVSPSEAAIRLNIHDISMEIFNHAEKDTILNTLDALRMIC
ncbi:hypothetical protein BHF69_05380 [Anaerostipes sp. 992a]|uniref:IS66 family insertion sequence element accessory protein TnpA n=1 Tax=Anaerostipes sp. 992a TaxID=1261637 RepID=UPI0009522726|nr:hypothetical protein [Anaerostipes sp. 992a]OLR62162.1 hypothetical protein BHF69_05380 [Anaerostipes sp. 992a]